MKFIKWLFSGEVLFAGFLLSSVFKGIFDTISIDLTLLFMILTLFIAAKRIIFKPELLKISITPTIIFIALSVCILVTLTFTSSYIYGSEKALRFLTITAWSFLGVFSLIKSPDSLSKLLKGMLFFGSITIGYVFVDSFVLNNNSIIGRVGVNEDDNVLGLARLTAIVSILITVFYFYTKRKFTVRLVALVGFAVSMFVLLKTGSRMPLIALLISLALLIPYSFSFYKKKIVLSKKVFPLISLISIASIGLIPLYLNGTFDTIINRILLLFQQSGGASVTRRSEMIDSALNMWMEKPILGNGVGGFAVNYSNIDIRSYPHNIFMEVLAEFGLIGIVFLVALLSISAISIFKTRGVKLNTLQTSIILILIFTLINANVTGDINDNRLLFTFIALSCMISRYTSEVNAEMSKVDIPIELKLGTKQQAV